MVQAIGECMVEVTRDSGAARLGYSGDTYNTAVYLARSVAARQLPVDVRYLSGLGDDAESDLMRTRWLAEGIGDDAFVLPGRTPGLYMISTDDHGERSFSYWRSGSAAAVMFAGAEWVSRVDGAYVYLSGITLQLTSVASRARLVERLAELRTTGTRVVFDSNYRPQGWPSRDAARAAMEAVLGVTDIALVTLDDERALTGCADVEGCVERLVGLGVAEIAVKVGARGTWVLEAGGLAAVGAPSVEPVDTTAAGDSFNGAYLAARIAGDSPRAAAAAGNALASEVIRYRGAIIDTDRMPGTLRATGPGLGGLHGISSTGPDQH